MAGDLLMLLLNAMMDPMDTFTLDVAIRVRWLEGSQGPEKKVLTETCPCELCISARQFFWHNKLAGREKGATSSNCVCHSCVSAREGEPDRPMPDSQCSCELCVYFKAVQADDDIIDMQVFTQEDVAQQVSRHTLPPASQEALEVQAQSNNVDRPQEQVPREVPEMTTPQNNQVIEMRGKGRVT